MDTPIGYILCGWIDRDYPVKLKYFVWNPVDEKWVHPKAAPYRPLGMVKDYWAVCREI